MDVGQELEKLSPDRAASTYKYRKRDGIRNLSEIEMANVQWNYPKNPSYEWALLLLYYIALIIS